MQKLYYQEYNSITDGTVVVEITHLHMGISPCAPIISQFRQDDRDVAGWAECRCLACVSLILYTINTHNP